jgi:prepilin-type N-terminal cleavage/methylation domain-containing protein
MRMRREQGFSLIELMVSAAIMVIVLVGITRVFTVQHQTYVVVDQVAETQQNLRAVADLIERDVRRAGYMVPRQAAVCAYDATTGPDTLYVSNTDLLRTVYDLEDDHEDLSGDYGAPVTGDSSTFDASGSSFSLTLERLWVDVAADGDDFAVGQGVIVVNRSEAASPVACGKIKAIAGKTLTVDFGSTSTGAVGLNADVVAVPAHIYEVQVGAGGAPNKLLRDGQLLASDVEDFQLTYFFDADGDLVVDAGETMAGATDTAQPWELTPSSNRPDFSSLHELTVNVVMATRDEDPNPAYQMGAGQVTGNRTAASLSSADGKRRRVYSSRVRLRNAES